MDFISIDVETANPNMASICQIGIAHFTAGKLSDEWHSLVDPQDYFHGVNVSIHGISKDDVTGASTFADLHSELIHRLGYSIVVCHTHFDRLAIARACDRYALSPPQCQWLDSSCVARRAWPKFARKGYGLNNLCKELGYDFVPHDALEDAKAAAHVLVSASKEAGLDLAEWLRRVKQPIEPAGAGACAATHREANPDGPFFGEVIAFTGALNVPRRKAAAIAAAAGFCVSSGVTKKVTTLVVGDLDIARLDGRARSSKHRKAEELLAAGAAIRIIGETDFARLVELDGVVC